MAVPYALSAKTAESITPSNLDLIIGKWTFNKTVYLLDNLIVEVVAPDFCDTLSSYEFFEDNTIILISYVSGCGNCCYEFADFEYFNWSKLSGDEYEITSKQPGEPEQVNIEIVIFETNSVMFWPDYFDGTTSNGNDFDERRSYFIKH